MEHGGKCEHTAKMAIETVDVAQDIPKGILFVPFHFKEAAANMLTNPALDPAAKMRLKVCAAASERA